MPSANSKILRKSYKMTHFNLLMITDNTLEFNIKQRPMHFTIDLLSQTYFASFRLTSAGTMIKGFLSLRKGELEGTPLTRQSEF